MKVYIGLLLFIAIIAFINKKTNLSPKYFLWISFMAMTLVLGLRGSTVGEDTKMYLSVANAASRMSWKDIFSSFPTTEWNFISYGIYGGYSEQTETIYMAYNKLIMSVFHNPQWVLIITAAITCYFMMRFICNNVEQYSDLYLATYVYMCDSIYMSSFNIMRQVLALSIAVQAIEEVKQEKYKKAIVWVAIAACFHLSALLFVVVLLIYKLKEKRKHYKWIVLGVCILPVALPLLTTIVSKILPKYVSYLQTSFWSAEAKGTLVLWGIIIIAILIMIRRKDNDERTWWLIYMATIYIGVELIGMRYTVISRVAMYFRIGLPLFFPTMKKYFNTNSRLMYVGGILFVMTWSFLSYASSPARLYTFGF